MLITCPSCASTYDLPAARIGPGGRTVRCAACRDSWFVSDAAARPPLDDGERGELEIVMRPIGATASGAAAAPRQGTRASGAGRSRSGRPSPATTRVAIAAALLAGLSGLVVFRSPVVTALPGTAGLFAVVGLPVNAVGFALGGLRSTVTREGTGAVLEVAGEIRNVGGHARAVPPLALTIVGGDGEELYAWSARTVEGELPGGEAVPFRVRLAAPPPAGKRVDVTFRERGETRAVASR